MLKPNPVEEAVLEQWGINAIVGDPDTSSALEKLLTDLVRAVEAYASMSAFLKYVGRRDAANASQS
jgi:hypothetical protein